MQHPQTPLTDALQRVLEDRQSLSRDQARRLLDAMLALGEMDAAAYADQTRVAALLGALSARGETEEELAGFVDSLRARSTPIPLTDQERTRVVDTCGTGGDLSGSFNISTGAALVAAAVGKGIMVAKHGNRAVTSQAGSADVLEALGVPVNLTPPQIAAALRAHGFAFLSAPALQPAMKTMMPVRRALGVRTLFNLLGPMTNPAGAQAQVVGVYAPRLVPVVAQTLARLRTRMAFVVHGSGLDEFSISGPSIVGQVIDGEAQFGNVLPDVFGLAAAPVESLAGGDAETNAAILRDIFAGKPGPPRDVVVMNAAAVLVAAELAEDFMHGARLAESTIDSGAVTRLVANLSAVESWPRRASPDAVVS